MFGLAHRTVLLASRRCIRSSRDEIATCYSLGAEWCVHRWSCDGFAGFGRAIVLRDSGVTCWREDWPLIGRVIGLVRIDRDTATNSFAHGLEHNLAARRWALPWECVTMQERQAMSVLHDGVAYKRVLPRAQRLAVKTAVGIARLACVTFLRFCHESSHRRRRRCDLGEKTLQ